MKKIAIVSSVMLLVILASCNGNKAEISPSVDTTSQTSAPVDETLQGSVDEPVVLAQGFVEYDESYIGETDNTVLFFHAEWCGSCKSAEADIIANGVPSDLTVLKVDFDDENNLELRKKYGVTTKHTFVQVDSDGELVKKWEGSTWISDIQDKVGWEDVMMKKDEDNMQDVERDNDTMMENEAQEVMQKDENSMMQEKAQEDTEMEKTELSSGVYTSYDSSLLGQSDNTVLFFHASWCPSCVAADRGINTGEVPENLSILKTDFDSSTDLRKKYGVTGQHTFVQVDADGEMIKKWVGGTSVEDIVEKVQ